MQAIIPGKWVEAVVVGLTLALACLAGCGDPNAAPDITLRPANWPAPPGWLATYGPEQAPLHVVVTPVAAFALDAEGEGGAVETSYPAVPGAGLRVMFSADLSVDRAASYRFGAEVAGGTVEIEVVSPSLGRRTIVLTPADSGELSDPIGLAEGSVTLRYRFQREGSSPARLRALWAREGVGAIGFDAEPIPAEVVRPPRREQDATINAVAERRGLLLLGELGCVNCHAGDGEGLIGMWRQGPDLARVGDRASRDWLAKWVRDPTTIKARAAMPSLFHGDPEDEADLDALLAYLGARSGGSRDASGWGREGSALRGETLYGQIGCLACHGTVEGAGEPPWPFGRLAGKWTRAGLAEFLFDPVSVRPHGRMPSMELTEEEARDIAAYLVEKWGGPAEPASSSADPSLADRGRAVYLDRGCVACHAVAGQPTIEERLFEAPPFQELRSGRGCLDPEDETTPRYALSDADRVALELAVHAVGRSESSFPSPTHQASLTVDALGCVHCHEWHGQGGVRDSIREEFETLVEADLGDEGRLPPRLSDVGGKLHPEWLREVFLEAGRARPYMATRMPQFGEDNVGELHELLASFAGVPPRGWPEPEVTDAMVAAGHTLAGEDGLNCISCHVFDELPPAGTPGPDMTRFAERIRYEWWRRYALNPPRFKPGTRMPSFFIGGTSAITSVMEGDAERQIDSLWAYFTLGSDMPTPEGLSASGAGYEVRVAGRPRILRTFIEGVGSRAIAVGFPAGVHFAFDARTCRLAQVWTGDFLDASGAWANRGGTPTGGRGPLVWEAPTGAMFRIEDDPTDANDMDETKFRGYRVDDDGVPVFRYAVDTGAGAVEVEERVVPADASGVLVRREFTAHDLPDGVRLWIRAGPRQVSPDDAALNGWIGSPEADATGEARFTVHVLTESEGG